MPFDPQREGFQPLGDQPGIEWRHGGAEIAQQLHASFEDEGEVHAEGPIHPEIPCIDQAVIAGIGLVVVREALGIGAIVEAAAVDDHPSDGGAMAPDVLGSGMHHHIGPPLDRADQIGRRHGVIHHQRHANLMGHRRHGFDVEDVVLGVGDRFTEERLGVGPHRSPPGGGVIGIVHEGHRDAQLGQGVMEQVVGAAVEGGTGDDVIADLGDVQ